MLFLSLAAFLAPQERFAKWSEGIYLAVALYVLNIIVSLRGRASQENPFGVLYQIGRIYAWVGNCFVLFVTLVSGFFLSFPFGIGLALASATGLWGLFYTDKRDVPPDVPEPPKETPFEGKDDSVKEALTAEQKGLLRRKKWTTGAAEIFGFCALVCGIFIYMSLEKGLDSERFAALIVFGAFFLMVWLYMRKASKKAAAQKEKFYEEYPKARPALRYMHRVQERRLARLLPDVEQILRQNLSGISYTPPAPLALSMPRAFLNVVGIVLLALAALGLLIYTRNLPFAFLPATRTIVAGVVSAVVGAVAVLLRWRFYARRGYVPPEFRKSLGSLRRMEYVFCFFLVIFLSYYMSVHGVMRVLHESVGVPKERQLSALRDLEKGNCLKLPSLSSWRRPLCLEAAAMARFPVQQNVIVTVRTKTSVYGDSVEGLWLAPFDIKPR